MRRSLRFPAARLGCRVVRGDLPDELLEVGPLSTWLDVHLATCLACQADVGPGRAASETMALLAETPDHRAPRGLPERVLAGLGEPTPTERRRRRAAIGWSAGAVSAALAGAVVVVLRRGRIVGAH